MTNQYTDKEILDELLRLTRLLGHPPSYEDARANSLMGPRTFQRRLGPTWDDVKRHAGWVPPEETAMLHEVSPEDGSWLSGLLDGEGCFRIQKPSRLSGNGLSKSYAPVFCISLRADDLPTLMELRKILGTDQPFHIDSRESDRKRGMKGANPSFKFFIRDLPTLAFRLIPILERYPLRSKKRHELPVFKLAVQLLLNKRSAKRSNRRYTDEERSMLDNIYHALHDLKQYRVMLSDVIEKYSLPLDTSSERL